MYRTDVGSKGSNPGARMIDPTSIRCDFFLLVEIYRARRTELLACPAFAVLEKDTVLAHRSHT